MTGKMGWSRLVAAAAIVLVAACAGDAGEQEPPAVDPDANAPAAPPPAQPAPTVGANVVLPEGVTQEMVAQGQQIFNQQICFSCHGMNGVGTVLGPAMTDTEWINIDGSYESIMQVVREGVAQPVEFTAPMPPMGGIQLSDEQIRQVSAYVYALSHGG